MKQSSQLFKGSLSTIIIRLLKEHHKMYGYEITRKVRELTGGEMHLTEGALYPALHKLEADGILTVSLEQHDNRPRKYYSLTKTGMKEYELRISEMKEFIAQMQLLLNLSTT